SPSAQHPLDPGLDWARQALAHIQAIRDYSCVLIKRERIGNELVGPHRMAIKVRQDPFSVYLSYQSPSSFRGQEAIYVEGQNNNKVIGHLTGMKHRLFGAVSLNPRGTIAMRGNRYPITDVGLKRMLERIIEVGQVDRAHGPCQVQYRQAVIDGRSCSSMEIVHPRQQPGFKYAKAIVYVDDRLEVPVRFEAYGWPESDGDELPLIEEYTYTSLVLNPGFTDEDFSPHNPQYGFMRRAGDRLVRDESSLRRTTMTE
ncbi:MAG TPA: DUF1571 domain-containing protein, partial [Pirellulales bacterium]|nr:DUF1571 domain-containing protein [Pirellulales bacterium]